MILLDQRLDGGFTLAPDEQMSTTTQSRFNIDSTHASAYTTVRTNRIIPGQRLTLIGEGLGYKIYVIRFH
jgi:hypothetical protein